MAKSYEGVIFDGATFPDSQYKIIPVRFNDTIIKEYIPALHRALLDAPKGLKCLLIAMTHQEGFAKGTRSYRTNNPGNVGNTDSGVNKPFATLEDGIKKQAEFIIAVADGKKSAYAIGKLVTIPPYYSKEIAANEKAYGLSPYLPGYRFTYTGQLDQFIKIYSTGARATNSYINTIVSYLNSNNLQVTPQSKLADIIRMN